MSTKDSEATPGRRVATFRRKRRSYIDGDVLDATEHLIATRPTWGAVQIWRDLENRDEFSGRIPDKRTIQRWINERTPPPGEFWRLETADGEDAALILPVLAAVIRRFDGSVRELTQDEATWIVRLRVADPEMPLLAAYQLARMYLSNKAADVPTDFVDRIVAGAPWRSLADYRRTQGFPQLSPWLLAELGAKDDSAGEAEHD